MNFVRYHNLELPVFEPVAIPPSSTAAFRRYVTAHRNQPTMIREARLLKHPSSANRSLHDILDAADKQFERIADACGATVVGHTYGLMRQQPSDRLRRVSSRLGRHGCMLDIVPKGYKLVAEVDILPDVKPVQAGSVYAMKIRSVDHSLQCSRGKGAHSGIIWPDVSSRQMSLIPATQPDVATGAAKPSLVIHDIEPMVMFQSRETTSYLCGGCTTPML